MAAEAGDHDIDPFLGHVRFLPGRHGSQSATNGLQNQSEKIAEHKDDGVCSRAQTRNRFAVDDNDLAEADVYGGAEERRADSETNQVSS